MRHLPRIALSALAVSLCAAPSAAAHGPHHDAGSAIVAPARGGGLSGGELLGEAWVREPLLSGGPDSDHGGCVTLAHHVLAPHPGEDGTARCSAARSTRLFVFSGSFCSDKDVGSGQTRAEQLACALFYDRHFVAVNVTVDGGTTVNLVRPRFEVFSPQRAIDIPPDNVFGLPAGPATITAHAWAAVVRNLRPGRHTVTIESINPDFGGPAGFTVLLDVVREEHSDRNGQQGDDS